MTGRDWTKVRRAGSKAELPVAGSADRTPAGRKARRPKLTPAQRRAIKQQAKAKRTRRRSLPPASDVKVTRADGSVEYQPSARPLRRRSS